MPTARQRVPYTGRTNQSSSRSSANHRPMSANAASFARQYVANNSTAARRPVSASRYQRVAPQPQREAPALRKSLPITAKSRHDSAQSSQEKHSTKARQRPRSAPANSSRRLPPRCTSTNMLAAQRPPPQRSPPKAAKEDWPRPFSPTDHTLSWRNGDEDQEYGFDKHDFMLFSQPDPAVLDKAHARRARERRNRYRKLRREIHSGGSEATTAIGARRYGRPNGLPTPRTPKSPTTNRKKDDSHRDCVDNSYWLTHNANAMPRHKKAAVVKEFIVRNMDRMWMYNVEYMGKSHKFILRSIVDSENFPGLLEGLRGKERRLNYGLGSRQAVQCVQHSSVAPKSYRGDPFQTSLTTARSARKSRQEELFERCYGSRITKFGRVKGSEPEYGSFSNLNSIKAKNVAAELKR